ncbi:DEAD/DEAH box helicase [Primorskyibacter sp. S187A]|uniref:DEAD/DEAH box helicase n=1 Tax=Primorskyibacter sp. S187A TaxID=3415130 RepID=UPI003C7C15AF
MKKLLQDALDAKGYTELTPVQSAVLAPELEGRDLLVSAQTGSGKTVGFGLAIAPQLLSDDAGFGRADAPLGLVIAPTRELALQVKRELSWLYGKANAVLASCVGGMDMRDERRALERGAHIVAATPGRLRDHIMRGSIDLSQLRAVVLDEADEMLDLGFREDLEFILSEAPEDRQTLLFSATVPKSISQLAKQYQKDAERVIAKSETQQHADITYKAMHVAEHDTDKAVINTLLYHRAPNAIVFANTRAMVARLTARLSNRGFNVVSLSGELSQNERTHALQAMRDGRAQVCVATDVAARGIDLPNLDLVVHAELPSNHETLLHRSGRTGRAGRKGVSALIVTKRSRKKAERILHMAKLKAEWGDAPSADAVNGREQERMFADETWATEIENSEAEIVEQLTAQFTADQLAAAYLRLYRAARSVPEELSDVDAQPKPRVEFGPSVWFSLSGGRNAGAEPRRILPMLCKAGGLTKDDIGAIRIQHEHSFVQIKETSVPGFLAQIGEGMVVEDGQVLTQLAEAPDLSHSAGKPPRKGPPKGRPGDARKPQGSFERAPRDDKPRKPRNEDRRSDKPASSAKPAPKGDAKPARKPRDPATHNKAAPRRDATARTAARDPAKRGGDARPTKPGKPKGPKPPVGKPNSKKNKARAAAKALSAKGKGKPGKRGSKD